MKSSFLLTVVFSLMALSAWGQTTTTVTKSSEPQTKSSFDRFYDRLKIGYFGVVSSPTFYDMERGDWDNAAISPSWGGDDSSKNGPKKNQDTWPTNLWNQVNFRYNYGGKMDFVFAPRFMIPLAHSADMKKPEDRSLIEIEDFLVGFQGVPFSSEDKKFNLWLRPALRLPTSRASRQSGNAGFGTTSHQLELAFNPTYDFNTTWQVGIFGQFRQWTFENRYNWSRFRFYTAPYIQYTINDSTRIVTYYQSMIENNKRWKSVNGKNPVFKDYYQDVMIGVNKHITKKFNIYPYIGIFVDDVPLSNKSAYLGAWMSYQIK